MAYIKEIPDLNAMKIFANEVSKHVFPGFILGLEGDLGAGKTTFTQFFGAALGIKSQINSPTFTIIKIYDEGAYPLVHIDAYRLEGKEFDLEIEDHLDRDGVCVVEWYQYINKSLPKEFLSIKIEYIDESRRNLIIKGQGKYESISKTISY